MFNYRMLNKEFVDWSYGVKGQALCYGEGSELPEGKIFLCNGYFGYIISKEECLIDLERMEELEKAKEVGTTIFSGLRSSHSVVPTKELQERWSGVNGNYTTRRFEGKTNKGDLITYVNVDFLKRFKDCYFWQEKEYGPVFITNDTEPRMDCLVGLALPVRVY